MESPDIKTLEKEGLKAIENAQTPEELEKARVKVFGRTGLVPSATAIIPQLPSEERGEVGKLINETKKRLEVAFKKTQSSYQPITDSRQLFFDITLPGKKPPYGRIHPITQTIAEIEDIFHKLGFIRRRYPEVETDWQAFGSLNMPKNHPARDEWETFYVKKPTADRRPPTAELVLTPHTSSGQIREMKRVGAPVRMINISRCDRRQSDVSHIPTFYQFEGLVVDKGINITHLKGTLEFFVHEYFGPNRTYRLRPYDFRFTEPSFEIDVTCCLCAGKGCRACKEGWMELGGAGMVHPKVLKNGGLDPKKVSGFAFGWGVERVFMMRENLNISDIRMLYQNDLRFLEQF